MAVIARPGALAPLDRYYALFLRYEELRGEFGPDLVPLLTQIRTDILNSIGEEWRWVWGQFLTPNVAQYLTFCSALTRAALRYLRADERIQQLAGDDKERRHRLTQVVLAQLLTYVEAARLPGLAPLAQAEGLE